MKRSDVFLAAPGPPRTGGGSGLTPFLFSAFVLLFLGPWTAAGQPLPGREAPPALAPVPRLDLSRHVHDSWQIAEGLPQNTVYALSQTSDGYLWVGTQGGLARFNGVQFTVSRSGGQHVLPGSYVRALLEDQRGVLWIGTQGDGVQQYVNGQLRPSPVADTLSEGIVRVLHEDRKGNIWIGTQGDGLFVASGDSLVQHYTTQEGLSGDVVLALAGGAGDALWIGTEAGLTRLRAGQFTSFSEAHGLPGTHVKALLRGTGGTLWVGTDRGVAYLRPGQTQFSTLALPEARCGRNISALHEGARGALWIGTLEKGLCRYAGDRFDAFTTADGLTHNRVRSLAQDREGSLWIGTEAGGLNRLRAATFAPLSTEQGLPSDMVYAVMEARDGGLWMGTDGGGLSRRAPDGTMTTFTTADGLPSDQVISLAEDYRNQIWFGMLGGGLCSYADGRFDCAPAGGRLAGENVYALREDDQGRLWIGTDRGLARLGPEGAFARFTAEDGLSNNLVSSIVQGRDGILWIGTVGGGLNRFANGRFTHYGSEEGLSSTQVLALHEDAAGTLWIGMAGGGLCRVRFGSVPSCFTQKDGFQGENVLQIQEDGRGALWIGTLNGGILRVRKRDLNAYAAGRRSDIRQDVFDKEDGLPARELNGGTQPASWRGEDGRLYFATIGGVATVDPGDLRRNTVPPPVVVEELRIKDQRIIEPDSAGRERLQLSAHGRDLEIHYAGLSFAEPKKVTFQYRLVGYDDGWVSAGTRREAFYTNLAPGAYRFEVQARNSDGVWSETPATLAFHVAPFFYETWWFYSLCVLAAGLATAGGYRWRMWHVRERERRLEGLVEERTSDLRGREQDLKKVNAELEALNANLEEEVRIQVEQKIAERQHYEEELIEAKEKAEASARLKSTILRNMTHEIRTPISSILGFTEILADEVSEEHHQEFVSYIEQHGKRLLDTLNSILDLSRIEVDGAELSLEDFDLAEYVESAVGILGPSARQKGLALHTEGPDRPLPVRLDKGAIDRIVHNLAGNAIKFTETGEVVVRTRATPGGAVRIIVRDTGIGISEEFQSQLFEAFKQESDGLDRSHEGTGLGLSITKRLVEAMGGTIEVDSECGSGTTFTVTLPREARAGASEWPRYASLEVPSEAAC